MWAVALVSLVLRYLNSVILGLLSLVSITAIRWSIMRLNDSEGLDFSEMRPIRCMGVIKQLSTMRIFFLNLKESMLSFM